MTVDERDGLLSGVKHCDEAQNDAVGGCSFVDEDIENPCSDPKGWSAPFKWSIVALLSFLAFNVSFSCIAIVPIADSVVLDLSGGGFSKSAAIILVTIWELGEAAGPLLLAPLSEIFGRYIVLNLANAVFVFATILGALCKSVPVFIIARALSGFAVASSVLNPSIIGDMFVPEQHGSALALAMMTPLMGSAVGPVVGGAVGERFGWRRVVWICVGLAGICQILLLTHLKETRKGKLQQAKYTQRREKQSESLWTSATRPIHILHSSSVLALLCVFHAVAFATYYTMAVTLADIMENVYGVSKTVAGSSFLFFTAGTITSLVLCKLTIDRYYRYLCQCNGNVGQPEFWLPWTVGGSLVLPFAVLLYGWAAQLALPMPIFLSSLVLLGLTLCLASMPMFAYIVEAFGAYSASAMAGVIVTRCAAGVFIPMLMAPLIRHFGYGWSFTLVGAATGCVAPITVRVMWFGREWRQLSEYTRTE